LVADFTALAIAEPGEETDAQFELFVRCLGVNKADLAIAKAKLKALAQKD
jgi:hypothetical protein